MLDGLIQALVEGLFELLGWAVLWPVVMVVGTPFVLVRAAFLAATGRQRFGFAVRFGYYAVSDFWEAFI